MIEHGHTNHLYLAKTVFLFCLNFFDFYRKNRLPGPIVQKYRQQFVRRYFVT